MVWLQSVLFPVTDPSLSEAFQSESGCRRSPRCVPVHLAPAPVNVRERQTPPEVLELGLQPLPLLSHLLPLTHQVLEDGQDSH